jgi:histidyl-tRNA synthetase
MLAADALEALGIERGDYVIKVNNRKVLDGVLEAIEVTDEGQKLTILRAIDKLDRLGVAGVKLLLGEGRKDESGDYTKGAQLLPEVVEKIIASISLEAGDNETVLTQLMLLASNPRSEEGASELRQIGTILAAAGYDDGRIIIDPSVVRGLEYYTGPVYEAELTFEVKDEKGQPIRFGSVGGGGRYDGLVARFKGQPIPATGFSIGVSRLASALAALGKLKDTTLPGPVVVAVFDKKQIADYQGLVTKLRNADIRAELYLGNGKMGQQFKYADQRGSPCVVIQGPDEKEKGEVQIKDLIEGAKAAASIASNEEWRAERPAQFAVKEDELVEAVRALIARHES